MAHDQDGPAGRSEEWSDLLESCDDLVQSVTPEGRFLYVNRGWLETLGYTRDEVAGLTVFEVIHPDCRAHCEAVMGRVMAGEAIGSVEATFVSKTGEPIRVEGSINCRFRDGKPAGTRGIFRDISKRKAAEEALRESEARLRTIMAAVQDGIAVIDAETHVVVEANETALQMYGGAREEIVGRSCYGTICPRQEGECPITDRNLSLDRSEASLRTSTGEVVPVIKTARTVTLGGREHLVESFVNISERKQMEEQLRFLGWHDPLTGLFNRRQFEQQMRQVASAGVERVALVVCDVDGLKLVNDTLGHEVGDRLLIEAARLLQSCVREGDFVARIGGDEFALLLPGAGAQMAERICARVRRTLRDRSRGKSGGLGLSLGIAALEPGGGTANDLFRAADAAMYRDKVGRKTGLAVATGL